VGLPTGWPDVQGLALRIAWAPDEAADLLFARTGLGRVTRFVLTPARENRPRPLTTLLPYRSPHGTLFLAALFEGEDSVRLLWARGFGAWTHWADLVLSSGGDGDLMISFDPVLHELPGLHVYDWVRRLREPAYRSARRHRSR